MESPGFYHLYFNARAFFLIPKENLSTEQVAETSRLMRENINR